MSIYGPDLGLANRLRQWLNPIGVRVVEIDGWQSRGRTYATFNPYGSVNHHTAGGRSGAAPSLGICINGRSGLPGPLCNVHQQRDDMVNVVAAGVANHAGRGGWQALSGNQSVFGLEVEHCGYADEPFSERRLDTSCRVHAAFLSGLDRPDAVMLAQHFEWSIEGKIDFCRALLPGGAAGFRFRVAQLLSGGISAPAPSPITPTYYATSGQGGPMVTLYHPSDPYRADDVWIGPSDDATFGPVLHRFYTKDGWSQPENLGGLAKSVSASWKHDASQFRIVVEGVDGAYENVYDAVTGHFRGYAKLPIEVHS